MNPFNSILIYGVGMMGASLAHGIKTISNAKVDGVVRSSENQKFLQERKVCDQVFLNSDSLDYDSYDLVIIGLPVVSAIEFISKFPKYKGLVTDLSSTRVALDDTSMARPDLRFVGSHPMCGSEDSGPKAIRERLFEDRLCILVPNQNSNATDTQALDNFWKCLGMNTRVMSAKEHDEALAYLSHSPHLIAAILTQWAWKNETVRNTTNSSPLPITGGGFRDMTRIAGSNPQMWIDVVDTNRTNIRKSLAEFRSELEALEKRLETESDEEMRSFLNQSRLFRNKLSGYEENR